MYIIPEDRPSVRYAASAKHRPLMPVELICRAEGLPMPTPEYKFLSNRRFRFDWAWVPYRLALEIDGGVWMKGGGRHTRGAGFMRDQEKMNLAALHGWRVFRCTPQTIHTAMTVVKKALGG
jgi:hypothetical protein